MADLEISVGIDARQTKSGGAEVKREFKEVGNEVEKTGKKAKSAADRDFKDLEKAMTSAAAKGSTLGTVIGDAIGRAFDTMLRIGIQVVRMLYEMTKRFAEAGVQVYKAQQITKLSAETLSALAMQARRLGVSMDEVGESFKEFTRLIGEAASGSKDAEAKMARLGLDPVKAANNLEAAYRQVLQRIISIKNPVEQANAAMDAFGDTGYKLLPFLKSFDGDLDKLIRTARELGVVMSEDDVRAAKEFDKSLKDFWETVNSVSMLFGKELLPIVQAWFINVSKWVGENRNAIGDWASSVGNAVSGVITAFSDLASWMDAHPIATRVILGVGTVGISEMVISNYKMFESVGAQKQQAYTGSVVGLSDSLGNLFKGSAPSGTYFKGAGSASGKSSATKRNPLPEFGSMRDLVISTGRADWDNYFVTFGNNFGVDPNVLVLQAIQESSLNPNAVSAKGARGIAQFMPATAKRFGVNVNNVPSSIEGQAKYMSFLLSMFGGDYSKALAGYNAGEGAVQRYGGIPPFKETQKYVNKIKNAYSSRVKKGSSYGTYDFASDDGTLPNVPGEVFDTLDLASREKAIDLGKREIEIYQQLADGLWNLKEHTQLENVERQIQLGLYDDLDPKIKDAIRNWARLTDEENARKTALSGYNDMLQDLDGVIQQYNVQLGLSAELTRADAAAKFLASDAAKALTDAERQNLKEKAAHADQLRAVTKAQEEANRQYEQFRDTILDGLDAMQDGAGSFFSWMYDRFKNFLKQMVAEWLASKFFKMFYGGGNAQAAQGSGGGGILGGLFQGLFGGGANGQGPGSTPMFNGNATNIYGGPNQTISNSGSSQLFNTLNLRGGGTYTAGGSGGGWASMFTGEGGLFGPVGGSRIGGYLSGAGTLASVFGGLIPGRAGSAISAGGTGMALGAQVGALIPVIGPIVGALVGGGIGALFGWLFGNKAEKKDKKEKLPQLMQGFTDSMKQLRDLINDVRTLRIDPDSAISQATQIRQQIASGFGIQFESKKYQKESQKLITQRLVEADSLITELRNVSEISRAASERERRLLPEFAGGVYMSPAFRRFNGMLGGAWTGRDTIPAMVAAGEMILNPMQQSRVRANAGGDPFRGAGIPGYADGGVVQGGYGDMNLTVYIEQDAAGQWVAIAESDRGQKSIAKVVAGKYKNGELTLQKRLG